MKAHIIYSEHGAQLYNYFPLLLCSAVAALCYHSLDVQDSSTTAALFESQSA